MSLATPGGRMELRIKNTVADSGTQITIVPACLLDQSVIKIAGLHQSKVDLRAANNAQIDVQGVADATISALSPSGECFKTSSTIYIVRNVSEVYLSLDVLVGLRIVNEFFPAAGAGNQHGAQAGAWDRTGTVTEQLPHASYSVKVDGSGRVSQRTRQHLRRFDPHDIHAAPHKARRNSPPRSQRNCTGTPIVNRRNQPATPLASQDYAPRSPHRDEEEADLFETPTTRGRARARRQPPEDPGLHDFGDRDIYNHVDERDNDDRDVSEHIVKNQSAEEQDLEDQDARGPPGSNAANAGVPREPDNVKLELFPDDACNQWSPPPTQQLQSKQAQQLPPARPMQTE